MVVCVCVVVSSACRAINNMTRTTVSIVVVIAVAVNNACADGFAIILYIVVVHFVCTLIAVLTTNALSNLNGAVYCKL